MKLTVTLEQAELIRRLFRIRIGDLAIFIESPNCHHPISDSEYLNKLETIETIVDEAIKQEHTP